MERDRKGRAPIPVSASSGGESTRTLQSPKVSVNVIREYVSSAGSKITLRSEEVACKWRHTSRKRMYIMFG